MSNSRRPENNEFHTHPDDPIRTGLILVFDLDDTIAHTNEDIFTREYNRNGAYLEQIQINPQILEILRRAEALRAHTSKPIAGIFLYTNNSSNLYINLVHYKLRKLIDGVTPTSLTSVPKMNFSFTPIFDDVLSRNDPRRSDKRNTPLKAKTFADIAMLCAESGISTDHLSERVFFFDDQVHPDLMNTEGLTYVRITPPFARNVANATNYRRVNNILTALENILAGLTEENAPAGGRRKRRTRKLKRKSQKKRH